MRAFIRFLSILAREVRKRGGRTRRAVLLWLIGGACLSTSALAGPTVNLAADARAAMTNDEMSVRLAVEREGESLGPLNRAVLDALNEAIEAAQKIDGVRARIGSLQTHPRYTQQGRTSGYRVRGDVVLESRRFAELGTLAGILAQKMQLAGVGFQLSRGARAQAEQRLLDEAAGAFRARAEAAARAFQMQGYELKTLTIGNAGGATPRPVYSPMMAEGAMRAAPPVPVEGGETEVVVTISGAVELR